VVIRNGEAELPKGPGIGTRLNPDLFRAGRYEYRVSRV
jgi:L-alanine-DL-glutamate epimerase-like enolase superfamily enzyme